MKPDFAQNALRNVELAIGAPLKLNELDDELLERSRMMLERSRTNALLAAALLEDAGILPDMVFFLRLVAENELKKLEAIDSRKERA